jgi:hypothetical protein
MQGKRAIAYLGGRTKDAQDKMDWNEERYGKFIDKVLTKSNKEFLKQTAQKKIRAVINRVKL